MCVHREAPGNSSCVRMEETQQLCRQQTPLQVYRTDTRDFCGPGAKVHAPNAGGPGSILERELNPTCHN